MAQGEKEAGGRIKSRRIERHRAITPTWSISEGGLVRLDVSNPPHARRTSRRANAHLLRQRRVRRLQAPRGLQSRGQLPLPG